VEDPEESAWREGLDAARAETIARASWLRFMAVRIVPLGCAFVPAFVILILLFGGLLSVIGWGESLLAGRIALGAALVGAAAIAIALFRWVVTRWWWYRRLM
jgi:hypothetical protein